MEQGGGQTVGNSSGENHLERLGFRFNSNAVPFVPMSGSNSGGPSSESTGRRENDSTKRLGAALNHQNPQERAREGNSHLRGRGRGTSTRKPTGSRNLQFQNSQERAQEGSSNSRVNGRGPVTKKSIVCNGNIEAGSVDTQQQSAESSGIADKRPKNKPKNRQPNDGTSSRSGEQNLQESAFSNRDYRPKPRSNYRGGRGRLNLNGPPRQSSQEEVTSVTRNLENMTLRSSGKDSTNQRQISNPRGKSRPSRGHPRHHDRGRRRSDNFGPEVSLRERLTQQVEHESYECTICSIIIRPFHKIWSCNQCYHLLHLACAKRWASTDGEERPDIAWRCPTCNAMNQRFPDAYFCFCGKTKDPVTSRDELPHSCGGTCGKKRGPTCTHPCTDVCHPGPCSECPVQVTRKCACGLTEVTVRCGTALQRKCDTVCGKLLNCQIHTCSTICHSGNCEPCEVTVDTKCYCGKTIKEQFCGQEMSFSCNNKCEGTYDCGMHKCKRMCHSKVSDSSNGCGACPDSPERIVNCPCGKTSIKSLLKGLQRETCSDPIPTCNAVCGKVLHCQSKGVNHRCQALCHNGPCPPCSLETELTCKCQKSKKAVPCKEFLPDEIFECERVCKKVKSCGLHKCLKKCCQEDQHICMQICDKTLNCGKHRCERLCHPGQCFPCTHATFDEEFCLCGRTVYMPPIKCGAQLAECTYPCRREHACNHEITHNCHREEHCPPCIVLTSKLCAGGHETRKNIPCHVETISCGQPCGKMLRCEVHECNRKCHRDECEKTDEICKRPCSQPRADCEHNCGLPCHGKSPCQASDCKAKMMVQCECGRRREELRCVDVSKNVERLRAIRAEEQENRNATAVGFIQILRRSASMDRLNSLPCDSECNRIARMRSMAEALDIEVDENGDQLKIAPISYSDYLRTVMKNQGEFLLMIEKAFIDLVRRVNEGLCDNVVAHNFKPMRIEARRAIHEYAEYFGLGSESVDSGAQRSVVVTAKKGSARIPAVTLTTLAARFPKKLNVAGPINISSECIEAIINVKPTTTTTEEPQMKPLETRLKAVRRRPPPTLQTTSAPISLANPFAALADADESQEEARTSTFDPFADEPIVKSNESEKMTDVKERTLSTPDESTDQRAPDSWEDAE